MITVKIDMTKMPVHSSEYELARELNGAGIPMNPFSRKLDRGNIKSDYNVMTRQLVVTWAENLSQS